MVIILSRDIVVDEGKCQNYCDEGEDSGDGYEKESGMGFDIIPRTDKGRSAFSYLYLKVRER